MIDYTELQEEIITALGEKPEAATIKQMTPTAFQDLIRSKYEAARFFGQTHEDAVHYIANYLTTNPWQQ